MFCCCQRNGDNCECNKDKETWKDIQITACISLMRSEKENFVLKVRAECHGDDKFRPIQIRNCVDSDSVFKTQKS